jgi:DNA-binding NtrC family response regulator
MEDSAGAEGWQDGAFERAIGGSIYFDEVGELPQSAQRALLDVLDIQRLDTESARACNQPGARVFAATRRDLRAEANQGSFQADLYVRLATDRIDVPPLRERREDIEELVEQLACEITGTQESPFAEAAMQLLRIRWWSGNIRELRDVVENALLIRNISPDSVPPPISETFRHSEIVPYRLARGAALAAFERSYLSQLIEACSGNASGAARVAEMDRPYLLSLLRKHGLR